MHIEPQKELIRTRPYDNHVTQNEINERGGAWNSHGI